MHRNTKKAVIHIDMDAFYPAVEVLDNPDLRGKPVVVGGSRERGVVSSASYEARKYGIHSALPVAGAMRLCPHAVFLPGRMWRYRDVSRQVFGVFHRFTPLVEKLSIDEAFLDVSGCGKLFGAPEEIAGKIKEAVFKEVGLTASAGVAPSKFVAKIASDMEKPDGLTVVAEEKVREFLDPLPVSKMWGVGKVTREALAKLNIRTFLDLSRMPVEVLERRFGKYGVRMHELSMGIDDRDVVPEHDVKSIGHEETFSEDIVELDMAGKELLFLAGKVARRMRQGFLTGKTVTLKVKYSDFTSVTRSATLPAPTDDAWEIYRSVLTLLNKTAVGKRPVRLLGVSLSQLAGRGADRQMSLFEENETSKKKKGLNTALDSISDKFGDAAIGPGILLRK
ncbi:MAG TPA: DNA polymerase IV [Desulfobacteraceae bacterium]|nr:DNA polymerase IV [Desulfobacteraceae bacterium]